MWGLDRRTLAWICAIFALREFVLLATPLELLADEAHYWEWSRRFELSYATKGPGVAWIIALSTSLFGDTAFGVRALSPLFGAITAFALAQLAKRLTGRDSAGTLTVILVAIAPPIAGLHLLQTIDGPLFAAWAVALWCGHRLLEPRKDSDRKVALALLFGLAIGLGFLAKYTILLLLPGLWIYAKRRGSTLEPAQRIAIALGMILGFVPVVLWNAQHDWVTVQHLLGHLHAPGGDRPSKPSEPWITFPDFLLWQAALMLPWLPLLFFAVKKGARQPGEGYLLAATWPIAAFHLTIAFAIKVQPNWPLCAWLGVALWLSGRMSAMNPWPKFGRNAIAFGLALICLLSLLLIAAPARDSSRLPRFAAKAWQRLNGHEERAREVQRVREQLPKDTLLIARRYGTASSMAFYLPDHPRVYCAQHAMGGRKTPYDYFKDTQLYDPQILGRPALLFGADAKAWTERLGQVVQPAPFGLTGAFFVESYPGFRP